MVEFNRMLSELDAGLLIGGGATVIFAILVYLMTNRNAEEDEATLLYRELISSLDSGLYREALTLAKSYRVVLSAKTQSSNDLGESYFLIADSADHLGLSKLALLSAGIACHYLHEESVQSYPLYRKCRENSIEITVRNRARLTEEEIKESEQVLETLCTGKMEGVDELFSPLEHSLMN